MKRRLGPICAGTMGKSRSCCSVMLPKPCTRLSRRCCAAAGVSRKDACRSHFTPCRARSEPVEKARSRYLQNTAPSAPPSRLKTIRLPSRRACAVSSRNLRMRARPASAASSCCRIVFRLARSRSACLILFSRSSIFFASLASSRSQIDIAFLLSWSAGACRWCFLRFARACRRSRFVLR